MLSMSGYSKLGRRILQGIARLRLWKPAVLYFEASALIEATASGASKPLGDCGKSPNESCKLESAEQLLHRAIKRAPSWAAPHMLLAQIAHQRDAKGEQERHLWMALQCKPDCAEAETQLMKLRAWRHEPVMRAWHLYYSAQPAQAIRAFEAAQQQLGQRVATDAEAEIQAGLGWSWHAQQAWDRAEHFFDQAVQADQHLAHAWKGLGLCRYHLNQLAEAELAFDRALQLNAQAVDVVALLGWCAYAGNDFATALRRFEAALEQNPLLGDAWWGVAWCQWRNRNADVAGHALIQARKWAPDHPSAAKAVAIFEQDPAYFELLRPNAEVEQSEDCIEVGSEQLLWDALEALQDGNLDRAWTLLQDQSLAEYPVWQVELLRGRVQQAGKQTDTAIHHLQAARQAAPHRADAAHELSRYLNQLNREDEAQSLLQQYPNQLRTA
jgi:Tfp pilus assembly protein PilF